MNISHEHKLIWLSPEMSGTENVSKTLEKHGFLGVDGKTEEQLFEEYEIEHLDVLHCDIDHSELSMLETSKKLFKNQKIKFLILSTHGLDMHNKCLDFLESCDYQILYNHDDVRNPIGFDLLIVAQAL